MADLKVRDRSAEFAERRAAAQARYGHAGSSTLSPAPLADQLLLVVPLWSRLPDDFHENALALTEKIEELGALHLRFLKPSLRGEEEEARLRGTVDRLAAEIQASLKTLEHVVVVGTQLKSTYTEEEVRIVKNVRAQLVSSFKDLALHFKSTQEYFGTQLRRREQKSSRYMKIGSDAAYEAVQQEERTAQFLEMGFTEQDVQALLVERMRQDQTSKEIKEILDSIQEIHTMFEDVHMLVVDQGTMLDRIDYNVDQALVSASKAQIELEKARENQSACVVM